MGEADLFAREAAAIAAFESFVRQQNGEGRGPKLDWEALSIADRDYWRGVVSRLAVEVWKP